jgi:myo-inositol-1(or 4)-monophosphatase
LGINGVVKAKTISEDLRNMSVRISREAAKLLSENSSKPAYIERVEEGGEAIRADLWAEELILNMLKEEGFAGKVITEERGILELGDDHYIAIIDPLDGSKNYTRSIKWCSISIAFAEKGGKGLDSIIAGSVHPIFWDEPISFSRSEGVFLGDRLVTREEALTQIRSRKNEVYLAVYMDQKGAIESIEKLYRSMTSKGRDVAIRSLGSAALELAFVSLGRIDAFIDARSRLRIVDAAAGAGMVIAQGGYVLDLRGNPPEVDFSRMHRFDSLVAFLDDKEKDTFMGE